MGPRAAILAQLLAARIIDEAVRMFSLASSATISGSRVGLRASMFSYLQQYHHTRRSPSLFAILAQDHRGRMMQEPTEAPSAEALISRV